MRTTKLISNPIWFGSVIGVMLALAATGCDVSTRLTEKFPKSQPNTESSVVPYVPVQSSQTAEMEEQLWQRINDIRDSQGLDELQPDEKLAEVARQYSQQMAEQELFSRSSSLRDTPAQQLQSAGITYWVVGKNLFKSTNSQPVNAVIKGWMDSPGQLENILRSEYRETGIGIWQEGETYYITQLFLRRSSAQQAESQRIGSQRISQSLNGLW